jgi:ubiquinol-cytochrome c reductase iron-sulfur subunit
MTASRGITLSLLLSVAASIGLVVIYLVNGGPQVEAIFLALALGGFGTAIIIWAVALLDAPTESEARHSLASSAEARAAADEALAPQQISRRRFLIRLLAGAGAALAAALVLPAFSLGPTPGQDLFRTAWRKGRRVVDGDGHPVRPGDLPLNSVRTVFPEGFVGRPDSQTLLIKVRPADLKLPDGRNAWAPEGALAYSKVCTHAGCPVGLYRAKQHQLLCPCHQSTFDVLDGATVVFGPAARPLPQLPMEVDADGYLVALGDFPQPIGPGFWDMTQAQPSEKV